MSCDCRLCQDDREAAASWLTRAAKLREDGELLDEALDLEAQAARTLDRVNSYPPQRIVVMPGPAIGEAAAARYMSRLPKGVVP
jgi:hypothetical protein